jgi:hypothetical protein
MATTWAVVPAMTIVFALFAFTLVIDGNGTHLFHID